MRTPTFDELLDDVSELRLEGIRSGLNKLTGREREILKLAIRGQTAGQSATGLGISVRTVELHRQHALQKLKVKNLTQAVRMIALALHDEPRPPLARDHDIPGRDAHRPVPDQPQEEK